MTTHALTERPTPVDATVIEQALIGGDLSKLTTTQRVSFYKQVCDSLGLNPLTKPFAYITLNGKLTLYALKDCTEQLRSTRNVSVQIVGREVTEDCYVVTARASLPSGRQDESIGAVPLAGLKGEARANAMMKAETKAKRRVTLSICGLGILDETEIESIPSAHVVNGTVNGTADVTPEAPSNGSHAEADDQTRSAVAAPVGFAPWWDDMQCLADEGIAKLTAAWNTAPPAFCTHLVATNKAGWLALKARAQQVKA